MPTIINVVTKACVLISAGQGGWPVQTFYQICMTTLTPEDWATVDFQT